MNYIKKMQLHYLHGGNLIVLLQLLFDNKFRINLKRIPVVIALLFSNILNIPFIILQNIFYRKKVKSTEIMNDPVFILGHWRSGTTFLANLLTRDEQFGYFNILQTYHPSTYILLKPFLHFFGRKIIPKQRPQDNIKIELDLPQEEDYAVANRSIYSMVHFIAFPRNYEKYFTRFGLFEGITEKEIGKWKKIYINEIKKAAFSANGKQLVIKTPINTARIKVLLEMFPNAKFVHIHRDPYKVCLSTQKVYRDFFPIYDLQYIASENELQKVQLDVYEGLYRKYLKEKDLIPKENFAEISYTDLTENPLETLKYLYQKLGIMGFEDSKNNFRCFIAAEKSYKTHLYKHNRELYNKIRERLEFAFNEFGYSNDLQDE